MHRKIFAVGDSHSRRCFEDHPYIADSRVLVGYNKLDGKTAFNLERHKKKLMRIIEPLREKELIFCFGEVDVRLHIKYKHLQLGSPVEVLIQATAEKYVSYVSQLRSQGFRVHVFNVVPTGDFLGPEADKWKQGLRYPFTASADERKYYTEQLNKAYHLYCKQLEVPFIDIYADLVDENGVRKQELVFDFAHLGNRCADLVMESYFSKIPGLANSVEAESASRR